MAFCFSVKKWFTLFVFFFFSACKHHCREYSAVVRCDWVCSSSMVPSAGPLPATSPAALAGYQQPSSSEWTEYAGLPVSLWQRKWLQRRASTYWWLVYTLLPVFNPMHQLLPNQHTTFAAPPMVLCLYINVCQQLFVVLIQVKEPQSIWLHDFSKWSKRSVLLALFSGLTASDQKLDSGKAWEWGYCVLIAYAAWLVAK